MQPIIPIFTWKNSCPHFLLEKLQLPEKSLIFQIGIFIIRCIFYFKLVTTLIIWKALEANYMEFPSQRM